MRHKSAEELRLRELLSSPYYIARDIERKEEQIARLRELSTKTTSAYTAEMVGGTQARSKVESCVIKITTLEDEIAKEREELCRRKDAIMRGISKISDIRQQQVLIKYHLDCMAVGDIALELGLSVRTVKRLLLKGRKNLIKTLAWPCQVW